MIRVASLVCGLGIAVLLSVSGARAEEDLVPGRIQTNIKGNDTGGILSWSPENESMARDWTSAFCAGYGKYPRITAVHRQYGDYISFNCIWNPESAPFILPRVPVADCHESRHHGRHHEVCD